MDFVAAFSGGKDSSLSIIDMIKKGHRLVAIVVALEGDSSWIHQIDQSYFERFADIFSCQIIYIDSSKEDYQEEFLRGLIQAKNMGAGLCVFGDINIEEHIKWNESVAARSGLIGYHPLLNRSSRSVVEEIIDLGIRAKIVRVAQGIDTSFIGRFIDDDFLSDFSTSYPEYDICGENCEYHTRVDLDSLEAIVDQISLGHDMYFDNASTCFPKAPGVSGACSEFISNRSYSINRGTFKEAYELSSDIIDHRESLIDLFGGDKKTYECIFSSSATQSINTVMFGSLKRGDHIIVDDRLHNSAWRVVNKLIEEGVDVDYWRGTNGTYRIEDLEKIIRPNTNLVFLTLVDNVGGSYIVDKIDDYRGFISLIRKNNISYIGDGVQLVLEREFSLDSLDIDIFIASSHIGMMSTEGLSYIIGKKAVLKDIQALIYGGTGSQSNLETMPNILPDKFEAGTNNSAAIFSAMRAVSYINDMGIFKIIDKKHRLGTYLRDAIAKIDGLKVLGEGSFCLVLPDEGSNIDMSVLMFSLDYEYNIRGRVGVQCSKMANDYYRSSPGGIRFTLGFFNNKSQVDYLIDSIEKAVKNL